MARVNPPPLATLSRRAFLHRLAVLGSLAATYPAELLAQHRAGDTFPLPDWLVRDPWQTLAAVQRHLFPAGDDTPGAEDIGAIQYLYNTLENPTADGEDKDFMFDGVGWLNELTQKTYQKNFVALNEAEREAVLRDIEQSRAGRNWLSLLLTFLLEALLADPVYGGNPKGIGWDWLEHQPGFPAPPADKTWYRIGERVTFQRKAT